jgi:hypothetical protein
LSSESSLSLTACTRHFAITQHPSSVLLPPREQQTKQFLTSDLIMPRAKAPVAPKAIDSDVSSPPNTPRLAPVKARTNRVQATNKIRALPLQPSVITNTPKKRPHEDDDQEDAPKPKKTRKNDDKPTKPVSRFCPWTQSFLALPAHLAHIDACRS